MTAGLFRAHLERNVELDEPRIPRKTVKVTYASRRQQASGTSSPKLSEVVDASCARPRDSSLEKDRSPGAVKRARKDGLLCIDNFFRPLAPVTVTKTPPSPAAPTPKLQKPATPNRTAEPPQVYEQLHLDLGQKGAGTVTCKDCHMEYAKYKSEDAAIHERYHRVAVNGVDWQGYKGEVVTDEHADGSRVVMVKSDCSQFLKKKVAEVVGIVNKDLGAVPTEPGASRNTVFILVSASKRAVGCAVVESITTAYRVLPSEGGAPNTESFQVTGSVTYCCTQVVPATCGISRVWVLSNERRKGFGMRLLEAVRNRFVFGCQLESSQVAFTQPSLAGKALAERFCGRKDFLVY